MLKFLGLAIISLTCVIAGTALSQKLKMRCRELELAVEFIDRVENEIRYTESPCEEIIRRISADSRFSELKFLDVFCSERFDDLSFETRFKAAVDKSAGSMCFKADDVGKLKEFSSDLGLTDVEGQLKNCRLYSNLLKNSLKEANDEKDKKCRLYRSLSVMCAAAVTVILM